MPEPLITSAQTNAELAESKRPETPGPKYASNPVCMTPATVDLCRADYLAGAELRRKFDATAKRQHRGG